VQQEEAAISAPMPTVELRSGDVVPALGLGTWHLGDDPSRRPSETAALRLGLDLGMNLVDTAEMYGNGASEELVGEALADRRDDAYLVDKVLPSNATRRGTVLACERSLRRLDTDRLDLYLLHWRGSVPLTETVAGFTDLMEDGRIRSWGVSNFDLSDMLELVSVPKGAGVVANQVLYNLTRRGIEWDLLPWCRRNGIVVMAYSPIEQGRLLGDPVLARIAARHEATPAQIALAWLIGQEGVVAIPQAGTPKHVREDRAAAEVRLTEQDLAEIDRAFPPPDGPRPLEMI
jgi:diketogulonate reductase-like aldo/keto reductase